MGLLRDEMVRDLQLMGCKTVGELDRSKLAFR